MTPKHTIAGCAIALVAVSSAFAQSTVGVLDPNPSSLTIQNSPANVGNASFVTLSSMNSLIATAFANDTGGVINFDPANGWTTTPVSSINLTYGTSQANSLTMSLGPSAAGLTGFASSTGSGTTAVSGANYLAFSGGSGTPPLDATLNFSQGLSDFGITQLARSGDRTLTLSFTLQDNTVVTYAPDTVLSGSTTVNFYGYQAPVNDPIKSVTLTCSQGFFRMDDLAFVVAPEPGTMALVGMGGLGMLFALRRRSV